MREKLGKRIYAIPFVAVILVSCIFGLAFSPILNATPHNLPLGIVNLDKGVDTPAGTINAGDNILSALMDADAVQSGNEDNSEDASDDERTISWAEFESQEELDSAFDNNELYGAVVIPSDFTESMLQANAANTAADMSGAGSGAVGSSDSAGDSLSLSVIINQGKNPLVANILQQTITSMMSQAGVSADVELINEADLGGGALSSFMAVQFLVLPLFIMTAIASLILSVALWSKKDSDHKDKKRVFCIQLGMSAVLSLLIALLAVGVITLTGGLDLPVGSLVLYFWLAVFCMMVFFVGLADLSKPLGILVLLVIFALGMAMALLPAEMLPSFWSDWVYPWAPQRYWGDALRSIVYFGKDVFACGVVPMLVYGVIGLLAGLVACIKSAKAKKA